MRDSSQHAHAAFQVALPVEGDEVAVMDASGVCHRGAALAVRPMTPHRMLTRKDVLTFFIEPQCAFADELRARCGQGITVAGDLRGLREEDVRRAGAHPSGALDPRLRAAMGLATERDMPMPGLAARVGLSPQRLRALARHQLGMPLTRWRMWARLRRTVEALEDGHTLAGAAVIGGFADQAHFTRCMRELTGVTPASVLPLLRAHSRRAV
ncbi:AraC family transcriptional regulator [Streptomyces sp. NPDC047017]|uniref:AraC family transcriptional regulator n=1 Tax=Streptomyces sp. NPDC047017 TaxID=3155024 RepID=UPI00340D789D